MSMFKALPDSSHGKIMVNLGVSQLAEIRPPARDDSISLLYKTSVYELDEDQNVS